MSHVNFSEDRKPGSYTIAEKPKREIIGVIPRARGLPWGVCQLRVTCGTAQGLLPPALRLLGLGAADSCTRCHGETPDEVTGKCPGFKLSASLQQVAVKDGPGAPQQCACSRCPGGCVRPRRQAEARLQLKACPRSRRDGDASRGSPDNRLLRRSAPRNEG